MGVSWPFRPEIPLLSAAAIQVVARLAALVLAVAFARWLGVEAFGVYAYALAILSVLAVPAEAGVPTLLMRDVATAAQPRPTGRRAVTPAGAAKAVLLAASTVSAGGLLLLWLGAGDLDAPARTTAVLTLLALPFVAYCRTAGHALRGLERVRSGQVLELLLRPMLALALLAVIAAAQPGWNTSETAMAVQLAAAALAALAAVFLLRRVLPRGALRDATAPPRVVLRRALPFALLGAAGVINGQADVIMLGALRTTDDAGVYRAAVQMAVLVGFGLQIAAALAAPRFARLHASGDLPALQRLVTTTTRLSLGAALPIAAILLFAGDAVLTALFGPGFGAAHAPLAVLAAAQLVNAGLGAVGHLMTMSGHERDAARVMWQTTALNVVLNAALIPWLGAIGAAAASAVSLTAWNLILAGMVRRRLGLDTTVLRPRGAQ